MEGGQPVKRRSGHLKELNHDLVRAGTILTTNWRQGRRLLVVLGAGASVEAGIPRMSDIFSDLKERLRILANEWNEKKAGVQDDEDTHSREQERLEELHSWFASLTSMFLTWTMRHLHQATSQSV